MKLFGIWLAAFCSASSHVLAGHHAAHQKFLNHKLNIEKAILSAGAGLGPRIMAERNSQSEQQRASSNAEFAFQTIQLAAY